MKDVDSNVDDVVLVFLLLTLDIFQAFSIVSIVNFEQLHVSLAAALPYLDSDEPISVNIPPLVGCSVLCEEPGRCKEAKSNTCENSKTSYLIRKFRHSIRKSISLIYSLKNNCNE